MRDKDLKKKPVLQIIGQKDSSKWILWSIWTCHNTLLCTGCISKNLMLNKDACQTKLTIGRWSSYSYVSNSCLMTKTNLRMDILKWIINEFQTCFFNVSLLLKLWASGFCWRTLYRHTPIGVHERCACLNSRPLCSRNDEGRHEASDEPASSGGWAAGGLSVSGTRAGHLKADS